MKGNKRIFNLRKNKLLLYVLFWKGNISILRNPFMARSFKLSHKPSWSKYRSFIFLSVTHGYDATFFLPKQGIFLLLAEPPLYSSYLERTREIQPVGHGAVAHVVGVEGDDADPRLVALPPHHDPPLRHRVHVDQVVLAAGHDVLPIGRPEMDVDFRKILKPLFTRFNVETC